MTLSSRVSTVGMRLARRPVKTSESLWSTTSRLSSRTLISFGIFALHCLLDCCLSTHIRRALKGGVSKNLRTLILTLPEVLWPGCEWQPLTMNDLMDSSAVKKAYRCVALEYGLFIRSIYFLSVASRAHTLTSLHLRAMFHWSPVHCRPLHSKAMTVLHPDKVSSLSSDVKLLAERVFDYVTKAWVAFQVQEKM
jgi:hypothetical protein